MKFIIPFPGCALALAIASLGNLLGKERVAGYWICGILAALLDVLWILGRISRPGHFREELERPDLAGVSGTFSMGLMVLSGYLVPFLGKYAGVLWYAGITLHLLLMIWFTRRFLRPLTLENVYGSCFIVYVGIACRRHLRARPGATDHGAFLLFFRHTPVSAGAGSDPVPLPPAGGSGRAGKKTSVLYFAAPASPLSGGISSDGSVSGSSAAAVPAGIVSDLVAGGFLPSARPQ